MQVIVGNKAGFCSGVSKAVKRILEETETGSCGTTLGPLVHNEAVAEYLNKFGIRSVTAPQEASGSFVAVRTHGVTPNVLQELQDLMNIKLIDLTCPRVRRVQEIVADLRHNKVNIYIFGKREHPEVEGLVGWAGDSAVVFSQPGDLDDLEIKEPAALVAQTTAGTEMFARAVEKFKQRLPSARIFNTLCPETQLRQEEVKELAHRVEALIVVGSETSANTKALYECCRQYKPVCRVNNFRELDRSFLKRFNVIGVTAGASTPPWTIKEVVESMENENMEVQNDEVKSEELQEETLEQEETQGEEQFQFDQELKVPQVGEQVAGKVARVTDEEVYVDIGAKTEAILPVAEVHLPGDQKLSDLFAPEDNIEVTVLDVDDQEGKVAVSHKRLAREKRISELEEALEQELILEAPVKQVVGAGMVIDLGNGIEGFMPGSLVDTRFIPDFTEFKDQNVKFKIIEFDREKGKLILSRKKIIEEESRKEKEATLQSIEVGSTITGTVKRLTDFGAFVDVGGIDGLVHISELSWERIGHPSEVLKVGEQIEVKVLEVISEKERISLSIRKTQPDPWTKAAEDLESGQIMTGKVTRLVNFGAFIELKPGVEGLAHISQLADFHVKHPSEVLSEGEEIEVKVIEVKTKSKRISLSVKDAGGVNVAQNVTMSNGSTDNGNVTLGDVFGDLFDKEDYQANVVEDNDHEADDKVEGEEE